MRVLFFQIATSCSNPIVMYDAIAVASSCAFSPRMSSVCLTLMPYMRTNLFGEIG